MQPFSCRHWIPDANFTGGANLETVGPCRCQVSPTTFHLLQGMLRSPDKRAFTIRIRMYRYLRSSVHVNDRHNMAILQGAVPGRISGITSAALTLAPRETFSVFRRIAVLIVRAAGNMIAAGSRWHRGSRWQRSIVRPRLLFLFCPRSSQPSLSPPNVALTRPGG